MLLTSISNIKASPVESTAKNIDTLIKFTFIHSFIHDKKRYFAEIRSYIVNEQILV